MGSIPNWVDLSVDPKSSMDNGLIHPVRSLANARPIRTSLRSIPFWIDPVFSREHGVKLCHKSAAICSIDYNKIINFKSKPIAIACNCIKNRILEVNAPPQQLQESGMIFLRTRLHEIGSKWIRTQTVTDRPCVYTGLDGSEPIWICYPYPYGITFESDPVWIRSQKVLV